MKPDELPTIVIDTREQTPLVFRHLPSVVASLGTADYSLLGFEDAVGFERKSLDDLIGSISYGRDRFERELVRLRGYRTRRIIIVCDPSRIEIGDYRSAMDPKSVWATLDAWSVRYDVPYEFHATPEAAAARIERLAWFAWRNELRRFRSVGPCPLKHQTPL